MVKKKKQTKRTIPEVITVTAKRGIEPVEWAWLYGELQKLREENGMTMNRVVFNALKFGVETHLEEKEKKKQQQTA